MCIILSVVYAKCRGAFFDLLNSIFFCILHQKMSQHIWIIFSKFLALFCPLSSVDFFRVLPKCISLWRAWARQIMEKATFQYWPKWREKQLIKTSAAITARAYFQPALGVRLSKLLALNMAPRHSLCWVSWHFQDIGLMCDTLPFICLNTRLLNYQVSLQFTVLVFT